MKSQAQMTALVAVLGCIQQKPEPPERPTGVRLPAGSVVIDLTHTFDSKTIYWPTSPSKFELTRLAHGHTPGGYFYSANTLSAPEHGGTHLDAPIHFASDGSTTERVPLSRLVAPGVVIDVSAGAARDRDYLIQPADIELAETQHGHLTAGSIVLFHTGWAARWGDARRYLGDATPGKADNLHFPGVSEAAAKLLVTRKVGAVGIDTASIDHGPSRDFRAHVVLAGADIPIFENVGRLADLPPRGALVIALPMKIGGGSGGPLRIVAALPAPVKD